MPDEPQFRVAEASDAELLLDFMQAYYSFDGHGYDRAKARAALIALLQNPNFGCTWLILDGDSPVGYAVLCFGYSLECFWPAAILTILDRLNGLASLFPSLVDAI